MLKKRPTGYISEIANLVPCCGKCNQSKGNKDWRTWMRSSAKWSPAGRGQSDVDHRFERLEAYERWRTPTKIDFGTVLGPDEWDAYWSLYDGLLGELRKCQDVADLLRDRIAKALQ